MCVRACVCVRVCVCVCVCVCVLISQQLARLLKETERKVVKTNFTP